MDNICKFCGAKVNPAKQFCGTCGGKIEISAEATQVNTATTPSVSVGGNAAEIIEPGLSKMEFAKKYASRHIIKNIRSSAIVLYIMAGLSMLIGIFFSSVSIIVTSAVVALLGLGIHIAKSTICAYAVVVLGAIDCLLSLVFNGKFSSLLIIAGGIAAIIACSKLNTEYAKYKSTYY